MADKKTKEFNPAKIKVIGVGGAGGNAISRMYESFPRSVDLVAINTDIQDIENTLAKKKIHIGKITTRGLGAGMNPDLGRQAAEEDRDKIMEALKDADMAFLTAGFGGGTGTGATPVVADILRELGIMTVAVVTRPFGFEGVQRSRIAEEGFSRIKDRVDALITIPNDRIFSIISKETSLLKAFSAIDEILKNSVQGVAELITSPGIINVDFADVKAVLSGAGETLIGIGVASGQGRAGKAAQAAVSSPLLETNIEGARGVIFSISGGRDVRMSEVNEVAKIISENADSGAKIIFGTYFDRKIKAGQLKVTLIATGFSGLSSKINTMTMVSALKPMVTAEFEQAVEEKLNPKQGKLTVPTGKTVKTKAKEDAEEEKKEDIWEIPAFLRRNKKRI